MRNAYALLGLSFLIVFTGAYLLFSQEVQAPVQQDKIIVETNVTNIERMTMKLTSSAFNDGETIPAVYTCDGENINPPLSISDIPEGTESFVLVMDDPDIPEVVKKKMDIEKFDHWVLYDVAADTTEISEGESIGTTGLNTRGEAAYTGPCPPTEYEPTTHRYIFRLYALSGKLSFEKPPTLDEVESIAEGMMLEKSVLTGLYSRVTE